MPPGFLIAPCSLLFGLRGADMGSQKRQEEQQLEREQTSVPVGRSAIA